MARAPGIPRTAIIALYGRLSPETSRELAWKLRPMAQPPGEFPLSGHPGVPTVLIYAADDEIFEPAWERFMAHELLGIEPIEIPGGHFPMAEDPEALAALLDRVAAEHPRPLGDPTGRPETRAERGVNRPVGLGTVASPASSSRSETGSARRRMSSTLAPSGT